MTGFLLAGVGNVDLRRKTNFLIVTESECDTSSLKSLPPPPPPPPPPPSLKAQCSGISEVSASAFEGCM